MSTPAPACRPAFTAGRLFFAALVWLASGALWAHGADPGHEPKVRAVLDALPAVLDGLHVELRHTLAPQLIVGNPGDRRLAIDDDNGRAFLRIGPDNVQADLGDAAFHRSNTLMGAGSIDADASSAPRWHIVQDTPDWGWFDLRLRTGGVEVPHAVVDAGEPATVGHWSVPIHYGDVDSAISGHFEYVPPAQGIAQARVTDTGALAGHALVRALTGSRRPGLFLSYRGDAPLVLAGADDEPFLRFTHKRVDVNRHSVTWRAVSPAGAPDYVPAADADADPDWARVSGSGSYGWIDPRTAYEGPVNDPSKASIVKRWTIPMTLGDTQSAIEGVTGWRPVDPIAGR